MTDDGFERRQRAIAEVKSTAQRWIQADFAVWVESEPVGAPLSYAHLRPTVMAIESMAQTVANEDLENVSAVILQQVGVGLQNMIQSFGQMKGMSKHDDTAAAHRREHCQTLWRNYDTLWGAVAAIRAQSTLLDRGALQGRVERASAQYEDLLDGMVNSHERLRDILGERGVDRHAQWFHNDARRYQLTSMAWLAGGALSLLCLGVAAFLLFLFPPEELRVMVRSAILGTDSKAISGVWVPSQSPTESLTALVLGKLAILSAMGIAAAVCFRNYAANKHNQVVNIHRASALQTFRGLIGAITDPRHQELVLVKAAESIYNAQPTGFSKHDGADGPQIVVPMAPYLAGMARTGDTK